MNITILFFGITTDLVGKNSIPYSINKNTSIKDLKEVLLADFSSLKNLHQFAIAVNEEYASNDLIINDGDVVAIIPPVSGG
ncbi:MAG: molybdopterin synthase sulfur carrier subunit [Lutibacter sp.]|uniref:MoaD/ThiS family protein n=1 Tax=Lutibacter sp. TaxID=1925666 RepID=UPI001A103F12|nr:MoaD/ThiS family protein [Lutibacter sp.]NOR29160.1 molybdopterin synthase sulfur carrier subunit [Lutibacter sp.]